jgi:hypothetical protein
MRALAGWYWTALGGAGLFSGLGKLSRSASVAKPQYVAIVQ